MLLDLMKLADPAVRTLLQHVEPDAIIVFAGRFSGAADQTDGYFERVRAIDRILEPRQRIYVDSSRAPKETLRKLNDRSMLFATGGNSLRERAAISLARRTGRVYIHSLLGAHARLLRHIIARPPRVTIWDVHGATPEEARFRGAAKLADKLETLEAGMAKAATHTVTVSDALIRHLETKHPDSATKYTTMPAAPFPDDAPLSARPLSFVYAGGTQGWQGFPEMTAAIRNSLVQAQICLMVGDASRGDAALVAIARDPRISVSHETPAAVRQRLSAFSYGFCVREDHILNRVACPTKLLEYMASGVVPVLGFHQIGDFDAMGLSYLPLTKFIAGELPAEAERLEMAAKNRELLRLLNQRFVAQAAILMASLT